MNMIMVDVYNNPNTYFGIRVNGHFLKEDWILNVNTNIINEYATVLVLKAINAVHTLHDKLSTILQKEKIERQTTRTVKAAIFNVYPITNDLPILFFINESIKSDLTRNILIITKMIAIVQLHPNKNQFNNFLFIFSWKIRGYKTKPMRQSGGNVSRLGEYCFLRFVHHHLFTAYFLCCLSSTNMTFPNKKVLYKKIAHFTGYHFWADSDHHFPCFPQECFSPKVSPC